MTITRALIALGAVLVLGAVNYSIAGKEGIKRDGQVIYLDLAPRDPRSIMQGDYMRLRFALAREIESSLRSTAKAPLEGEKGLVGITLDDNRVATLAKGGVTPTLKVRYRIRKGSVWLGTNAFFFEEGSDTRYNSARYGEFRVDPGSGEAVLVGLRDAKFGAL